MRRGVYYPLEQSWYRGLHYHLLPRLPPPFPPPLAIRFAGKYLIKFNSASRHTERERANASPPSPRRRRRVVSSRGCKRMGGEKNTLYFIASATSLSSRRRFFISVALRLLFDRGGTAPLFRGSALLRAAFYMRTLVRFTALSLKDISSGNGRGKSRPPMLLVAFTRIARATILIKRHGERVVNIAEERIPTGMSHHVLRSDIGL